MTKEGRTVECACAFITYTRDGRTVGCACAFSPSWRLPVQSLRQPLKAKFYNEQLAGITDVGARNAVQGPPSLHDLDAKAMRVLHVTEHVSMQTILSSLGRLITVQSQVK
jgi:hypothetical protein